MVFVGALFFFHSFKHLQLEGKKSSLFFIPKKLTLKNGGSLTSVAFKIRCQPVISFFFKVCRHIVNLLDFVYLLTTGMKKCSFKLKWWRQVLSDNIFSNKSTKNNL